jgi:hypothetical protein
MRVAGFNSPICPNPIKPYEASNLLAVVNALLFALWLWPKTCFSVKVAALKGEETGALIVCTAAAVFNRKKGLEYMQQNDVLPGHGTKHNERWSEIQRNLRREVEVDTQIRKGTRASFATHSAVAAEQRMRNCTFPRDGWQQVWSLISE